MGLCRLRREAEEAPKEKEKEKAEPKEKSSGGRKSSRYHPYKDRHGGSAEKKSGQRNHRVFVSNIPYDMKWQAIKDLMREKGNAHGEPGHA